ncbi:hypothetical protein ENSA5_10660 [Enhygromyxa salina]|uniref:Uncharacterized protein n=1 Tax=Enhygromyxa salina TaxID=215803 RepID=A0A2S9YG75_9BACT|nr:hypothetical protein [Enhygromyxa salina]PRQ04107.1 hypothetical protein ENSA5_10660 [Enhygromyxa salina]
MAEAAKTPSTEAAGKRPGKLRWLLGWIGIPGTIVALLFLAGVHVGARHPDMFLSRATLWALDGEAQLGPTQAQDPFARRLRLLTLPTKSFELEAQLSKSELDELVERGAGPSVAELDCAKVCASKWTANHPDKEFIRADSCELTQPTPSSPAAKIVCEATVQR